MKHIHMNEWMQICYSTWNASHIINIQSEMPNRRNMESEIKINELLGNKTLKVLARLHIIEVNYNIIFIT